MEPPWDAVAWWEKRRIIYNFSLSLAGLLTIAVVAVVGSHLVKPGEDIEQPMALIPGVIVYGFAANICYSLGWVTEILWTWGDTSRTEALRPKIFKLGLIFSIGLTLLPGVLIPLAWAILGFK